MRLEGKVVVVTGGASGIGRAMAERFAAEGARGVVVADVDEAGATATASACGGVAVRADVSREDEVREVVEAARQHFGQVDLFCSNAGIGLRGGVEVDNAGWEKIWQVNVMAHIYAARAVLPKMLERGEGYLLNTASAAGLLSQIGSAPYSVTKHAAVGLAEWLAISYGERGIGVSVLCPQAVRTAMTADTENGGVAGVDGMIEPEDVASCVVEALAAERFLILPHPEVSEYMRRKAADYERWIAGMRRLQKAYYPGSDPSAALLP